MNNETTAETRAEGTYALIPPSSGYTTLQGDLLNLPIISNEIHEELIDILRTFNEVKEEPATEYEWKSTDASTEDRPGDVLNRQATWKEVLEPHGWVEETENHWRRPGKRDGEGISATTDHDGKSMLYVFSTSADPFKANTGYSKFHVYTLLNHNGNFKEAARVLGEKYGLSPITKVNDTNNTVSKIATAIPVPVLWDEFNKTSFPTKNWRIKGLVPIEGFVILAAISGEGKTWIALEMANTIAQGRNFLNNPEFETKKGTVLYLDIEMAKSEFQRRGRLLNIDGSIHVLSGCELNLNNDIGANWLLKYIDDNKIDVVIVDTFRAVAGGMKEDRAEEVRSFFNKFRPLKSKEVVVIFLDHFRKPQRFEGRIPQKEHLFASQDKAASVESLIMMRRDENTENINIYQRKNRIGKEVLPFYVTMKDGVSGKDPKVERLNLTYGGIISEKEKVIEKIMPLIMEALKDGGKDTNEIIAICKSGLSAGDTNIKEALKILLAEKTITMNKKGRRNFYTSNVPVDTENTDDNTTSTETGENTRDEDTLSEVEKTNAQFDNF
ncbi:MAG: AAA family ATPase [bacterium]